MAWTLKGETAKTLDATARSLASLNISSATLRFQAVEVDTFEWTAATDNAAGAGSIIPDLGQTVEVWRDGVRKFYGWVTSVRPGTNRVAVTASGPWHWLDRIGLTGDVLDGTGVSAERPLYAAPTQDLAATLADVADRAISAGLAPMRRANVAAIYEVPNATLSEQSVASALATLLSWCPDAICWFDYADTTGSGLPILNFGRRGSFTQTTWTYGTDFIESADLSPRLDLEVARVEVSYVARRESDGRPQWAADVAGTHVPGKRQLIAVSGPEISDLLPKDDFESVTVTSQDFILSNNWAWLDPKFTDAVGKYGQLRDPNTGALTGGYGDLGTSVTYWGGNGAITYNTTALIGVAKKNNDPWPAGSWYFMSSPTSLPQWLLDQWGAFECDVFRVHRLAEHSYRSHSAVPETAFFAWGRQEPGSHFIQSAYHRDKNPGAWRYCFRPFQISGWAVPVLLTAAAIYKPWEYDFLVPPAGLAANLRAAQAWVPWEGPITLVADDCDGSNLLPRRYHLANGYPAQAAMGAMARAVEHDIMGGRTTIDLGAPARLDFGSLVAKIRRDPKDNIVWRTPAP